MWPVCRPRWPLLQLRWSATPSLSADEYSIRVAALEEVDRLVADPAVLDLDRRVDGLVERPCLRSAQHGLDEGQQRLAVLPGRRAPEVGGAVVDRVVADVVAHLEHRVVRSEEHTSELQSLMRSS